MDKVKSKKKNETAGVAFMRLLAIMDELREKCPWDKKQTIESIRHLTIEETYELSDAILDKNMEEIRKETGDLLLHVIFYSRIASETKDFDIQDVINGVCSKLIHRHPHIYGDTVADDAEQVKKNWEKLKLKEGKKSILEGIPGSLPSLVKAYRIQEKVKSAGFDWENSEDVWKKVEEEMYELKDEVKNKSDKIEIEFGDLLFSLINYARFIGVNPEDAMEKTNRKFIKRFQYLEEESRKAGKTLSDMSLKEMEEYWVQAKKLIPL